MIKYLAAYLITFVFFLVIDLLWLSRIARQFYRERLKGLLLDKPKTGAAVAFYALYVVGIVIFAVAPALDARSVLTALIYGSLFGLFAYATYDMTNYATLRNWPLAVTLVDVAWGTVLSGMAALAGYSGTQMLFQ